MQKRKRDDKIDPLDYSDEAERKSIRIDLYYDLKWRGGPFVYRSNYPSFARGATDVETEPSREEWRDGYLVLRAKRQQLIFWIQTAIILAVVVGMMWLLKRIGFL